MLKSKLNISLFVIAFFVTVLGVMLISRIRARDLAAANKQVFLTEGYDFRQKRLLNPTSVEPKTGTQINFSDLQTSRQEKLSAIMSGDLLLIAVLDPGCGVCQLSKDMLENLRSQTGVMGIKYLPVVLSYPTKDAEVQRYAEELGFETCIRWAGAGAPPLSLKILGTPSHVLLTKEGVVLQTWVGTNVDPDARMRMSRQIGSDLYLISDVIKAVQTK